MKEKSRTAYSILNILTGIGGYFVNTVLGFVCRIAFVQCLSAEYLGVNGLFTNILTVLSLAELGFGSAVIYALYKPLAEHDEKKIAALVRLYGKVYSIIGCSVAIIGVAILPLLPVIIGDAPGIVESIYVLYLINLFNTASTYFFSYKSTLIIAAQQNYVVSGINYIITILQSIIQIGYLYMFRNYLGYLIIQSIGIFLYNVIISKVAEKKFTYIKDKNTPELDKEEKKSLFKNVRDLFIYKVSGLLVNSTDNILITFFKGLATTGIASNYTLLINTLNTLLTQVFSSLTASIGNHNALNSSDEQYKMFRFMNLMNFWFFGLGTMGIIFCSSDLVRIFFGDNYVLDISIPLVLALNFYTVGMQNAVWTYKHTLGLFKYGRFIQFFTGIINIAFSIILGYSLGMFGIFLATFISRLFTNLWYDPYAVFKYGFKMSVLKYIKQYTMYLIVILIDIFFCGILFYTIKVNAIFDCLFHIFIVSVVFNITFFLVFRRFDEFKKFKEILARSKSLILKKLSFRKQKS